MGLDKSNNIEAFLTLLLGIVAIVAVKSIFDDDNSKIISKKGRAILSDDDKMRALNEKILQAESENSNKEIFI